jgi:hypothetical protein
MLEVTAAEYLDGYKIRVRFNNGREGEVDLSNALWGPVFEPLRDFELFRRFQVSDVLHTIQWENGADLAPEYLLGKMFVSCDAVGSPQVG